MIIGLQARSPMAICMGHGKHRYTTENVEGSNVAYCATGSLHTMLEVGSSIAAFP